MQLHVPTLYFTSVLVTTLLGCLFLFTFLQNRKERAILVWGLALLVDGVGSMLLALEQLLPPLIEAALSPALVLCAFALVWCGARLFEHRPPMWTVAASTPLLWCTAFLVPGFYDAVAERSVLLMIVLAGFMIAAAFEIWRGRSEPLISRYPALVLLASVGAVLLGFIPAMLFIGPPSASHPSPALGGLVLLAMLFWIGAFFSLLAVVKERSELRHRIAASLDPLTAAPNRRGFLQTAAAALADCRLRRVPAAVLIFDLDRFKTINDRFGHAVGDSVLKLFASTARAHLAPQDAFGRMGGEEFAAVLVDCGLGEAQAYAERVRLAFAKSAQRVDGFATEARVSCGVALGTSPRLNLSELLAAADAALYRAKALGRDRTEIVGLHDAQAARSDYPVIKAADAA